MAFTRNRNSTNNYHVENLQKTNHHSFLTPRYIPKPSVCAFPDTGVNSGVMTGGYNNNVLSNNAANIESFLFGIGSTNLVKPYSAPQPDFNSLNHRAFFERNDVFIPPPLMVERYQRPTIFHR